MTLPLIWFDIAARATVALCWMVFGVAALLHRKSWHDPERKRDPASILGFIVQGVAHAMVWLIRRQRFTPIVPLSAPIEIALAVVSIALGIGSVWMILAAMHTLGKHWSVTARLVEGHTLVTDGPYRVVRHPIYTANFGLLLATGLAFSRLQPLVIAILVLWIGTVNRMRKEETLLREAFGQEFEDYARRVPALLPRLH